MSDGRHSPVWWRRAARLCRPLWLAALNFVADEGPQRAGHIAFSTLLALFPFLIFLTALAGYLGQGEAAADFIAFALEVMPVEVALTVKPVVVEITESTRGGLLTISLVGALWFASSGVEALRVALNQAYGVRRRRPFWLRRLQGLAFVILASGGIILAVMGVVAGPAIWALAESVLYIPEPLYWLWTGARYGVGALGLFVVLCCLYHWLPNRPQSWRVVVPGALVALVLWLAAATLFSLYLGHLANYSVIYGSLGGVIVALVFFYVSAAVFIFGAEVNAVLAGKQAPASRLEDPSAVR